MSEAKHTPGPWTIDLGNVIKASNSRESIAMIRWFMADSFDETEGQANARLIAAAPELLQGAEQVVELIEYLISTGYMPGGDWATVASLKSAIAKAKGTE